MMNNRQLADTFTLIANLLEIKGEIIYKTLAYRKASESLMSLGREASEFWKEGKLLEIPGVGKAIAEKIDELLSTGKLDDLHDDLKAMKAPPPKFSFDEKVAKHDIERLITFFGREPLNGEDSSS